MRVLKSIIYVPHPSPLPVGEGIFRGSPQALFLPLLQATSASCAPSPGCHLPTRGDADHRIRVPGARLGKLVWMKAGRQDF